MNLIDLHHCQRLLQKASPRLMREASKHLFERLNIPKVIVQNGISYPTRLMFNPETDYMGIMSDDLEILWCNDCRYVGRHCYDFWGEGIPCKGCPARKALKRGASLVAKRINHRGECWLQAMVPSDSHVSFLGTCIQRRARKPKMLVAENPQHVGFIRRALSDQFDIIETYRRVYAKKIARSNMLALALVNLDLFELDFLEDLLRIKPRMSIIITLDSVRGAGGAFEQAVHTGVKDFILKPFSYEIIQKKVSAVLGDAPTCKAHVLDFVI